MLKKDIHLVQSHQFSIPPHSSAVVLLGLFLSVPVQLEMITGGINHTFTKSSTVGDTLKIM